MIYRYHCMCTCITKEGAETDQLLLHHLYEDKAALHTFSEPENKTGLYFLVFTYQIILGSFLKQTV